MASFIESSHLEGTQMCPHFFTYSFLIPLLLNPTNSLSSFCVLLLLWRRDCTTSYFLSTSFQVPSLSFVSLRNYGRVCGRSSTRCVIEVDRAYYFRLAKKLSEKSQTDVRYPFLIPSRMLQLAQRIRNRPSFFSTESRITR